MSDSLTLQYYRITNRASPLYKAYHSDAGYDLRSANCKLIPPGKVGCVNTDIAIKLPPGTYGRIAPRSGLALHRSIDIGGGIIDPSFRGNIIIIIFNHGDSDFIVNIGDRIAQLIVEKFQTTVLEEVRTWDSLTERGENCLGSSGV